MENDGACQSCSTCGSPRAPETPSAKNKSQDPVGLKVQCPRCSSDLLVQVGVDAVQCPCGQRIGLVESSIKGPERGVPSPRAASVPNYPLPAPHPGSFAGASASAYPSSPGKRGDAGPIVGGNGLPLILSTLQQRLGDIIGLQQRLHQRINSMGTLGATQSFTAQPQVSKLVITGFPVVGSVLGADAELLLPNGNKLTVEPNEARFSWWLLRRGKPQLLSRGYYCALGIDLLGHVVELRLHVVSRVRCALCLSSCASSEVYAEHGERCVEGCTQAVLLHNHPALTYVAV